MRYHSDPDQGTVWDYHTAVVSVGATRRFALRSIINMKEHYNFVVLEGDVTEMIGRCQEDYQHCVKTAEDRDDEAPRASLVFKQTWKKESAQKVLLEKAID